jgi:hypothetical protein
MREKTQRVLEWLYDATILYTPQSTPSTNDISYNLDSENLSEKKQSFAKWMKDHFFMEGLKKQHLIILFVGKVK